MVLVAIYLPRYLLWLKISLELDLQFDPFYEKSGRIHLLWDPYYKTYFAPTQLLYNYA